MNDKNCRNCKHNQSCDYEDYCKPCFATGLSKWEEDKMVLKVMLDKDAVLPTRAHKNDAGLDLYSREYALVKSFDSYDFNTGVHIEIPDGYVGMVKSKSGLNTHYNLTCTGVIDAGYTGSIRVKLYNNGYENVSISKGQKIAQLVIVPIVAPDLKVVDSLDKTERGNRGFGSTGKYYGV